MSEGLRRPEGLAPWSKAERAPGKGPHPLLASFAALGWRPDNGVVRWLGTLPRDTTVEQAIARIPGGWTDTLDDLGFALRALLPHRWDLLSLLPAWAANGRDPRPSEHPTAGRR